MSVPAELKNRGVTDVFILVCHGLKGLPESANAVFPLVKLQICIIHLISGMFRYASKKYWDQTARDLNPIYTAPRRPRHGRRSRRSGALRTPRSRAGDAGLQGHRTGTMEHAVDTRV